jgi:hypothetical protein
MRTDQIAAQFHARPIGDGYTARCPGPLHAHGDRRPSLRITEGRDGRTLIKCFVGCDVADIVTAAGLRMSDLFAEPSSTPRQEMRPEVRAALVDLNKHLTKRERVIEPVVILTTPKNLDAAIARALELADVDQEIVQIAFKGAP